MRSGGFGSNEETDLRTKKGIMRRYLDRELGLGDRSERRRNNNLLTQVCNLGCGRLVHSNDLIEPGTQH